MCCVVIDFDEFVDESFVLIGSNEVVDAAIVTRACVCCVRVSKF